MKLRNKKTGKIIEFESGIYADTEDRTYEYNSLTKLNAEWEDYEEPKEEWYINCTGEVLENNKAYCNTVTPEKLQSIGNYFETKEEAEKAVEKLKAWKRLKDKGFVFKGINEGDGSIKTGLLKGVLLDDCEDFYVDMELLFGGEE